MPEIFNGVIPTRVVGDTPNQGNEAQTVVPQSVLPDINHLGGNNVLPPIGMVNIESIPILILGCRAYQL